LGNKPSRGKLFHRCKYQKYQKASESEKNSAVEYAIASQNSETHPGHTEDRMLIMDKETCYAIFDGMAE